MIKGSLRSTTRTWPVGMGEEWEYIVFNLNGSKGLMYLNENENIGKRTDWREEVWIQLRGMCKRWGRGERQQKSWVSMLKVKSKTFYTQRSFYCRKFCFLIIGMGISTGDCKLTYIQEFAKKKILLSELCEERRAFHSVPFGCPWLSRNPQNLGHLLLLLQE